MLSLVLAVLLGLFQQPAPFVSQTVEVGGVLAQFTLVDPVSGLSVNVVPPLITTAAAVLEPYSSAEPTDTKSQTLSTTVKDPNDPEEPVTITTIRGTTESVGDFWLRHNELVKLVRKKLRTP